MSSLPDFSADPIADGLKAAYVPQLDCIYVERAVWNAQDLDTRAWTYFHEVGHSEGARCEPCADNRAGEWMRQIGWGKGPGESVDGALAGVLRTLQHRDPVAAARAVLAGVEAVGLDGRRAADAPSYNERTARAYSGGPAGGFDLALAEVRPGAWVAREDVADWEAFFKDLEELGINYHVDSSFREMTDQIRIWKERHDDPSPAGAFDQKAPRNERWNSEGPVAIPGYSEHQSGRAIDIAFPDDPSESSGSPRNNAARIGESHNIYRDAVGERWHFAHGGHRKYPIVGDDPIANSEASARVYYDRITGEGAGSESNPDATPGESRSGVIFVVVAIFLWLIFAD